MDHIVLSLGLSLHMGLNRNYNYVNPHIRLMENDYIAGVYLNSEKDVSLYGGYRIEPTERTGLEVGLVTGYSISPVIPFGRFTYDFDHVRAYVAPAFEEWEDEMNYGIVTGIEFKF